MFDTHTIGNMTVFGASTLSRYTEDILVAGFRRLVESSQDLCPGNIFQIHGSADAFEQDQDIITEWQRSTAVSDQPPSIILLHRPDEIQGRHPELQKILSEQSKDFGLVFLGSLHVDDSFYDVSSAQKKVIPHGFFDTASEPPNDDDVVIGTHTTWGDMRNPKHTLTIIGEVFRLLPDSYLMTGYLGGKPAPKLDINELEEYFVNMFPDLTVNFKSARDFEQTPTNEKRQAIFIDNQDTQPSDLQLMFNTQMYFYEDKVRTGESSGSLHTSVSIPVIFEMNGSEDIEHLRVIKVPYDRQTKTIESVNFAQGASLIVDSTRNGMYKKWLNHNATQAEKFNNKYVATQLNELLLNI